MILNDRLFLLVHSLVFKTQDETVRIDRIDKLAKIFNQKNPHQNLSQFVSRLENKELSYKQSKEMIDWFGAMVYDLKEDGKYCKIVSGYVEDSDTKGVTYRAKSLVADCTLIGVYFDADLNGTEFSTNKNYNRIAFTDFNVGDEIQDARRIK